MKKLILIAAVLTSGLLSAQSVGYPFCENFDAMTSGQAPTGTWVADGFRVMAGHGQTPNNGCSVRMNSANPQDTLVMPLIGPLTASSVISLNYRFVDFALYPATGTTLGTGDKITIDAYIFATWFNAVGTVDMTTNPTPMTTWTTFTYTNGAAATQNLKLRLDIDRANGDWYLDIDDVTIKDAGSAFGVSYNPYNAPALVALPNPSNGSFVVWLKNYTGNGSVELKLFNHMGQLIKTITQSNILNNQFDVNTTDLAKGVYMVEVKSGNEISKTKVVVE